MKETLTMKVGEQIGSVLLDIAQQNILKGNIDKAIDVYTRSFRGMEKTHVISILKNEFVLIASEDGESVELTTDKDTLAENKELIYDWQKLIDDQFDDLRALRSTMYDCRNKVCGFGYNIYNLDLMEAANDKILASLCARAIAHEFGTVATSAYQRWERIEEDVIVDDATDKETIMVNVSRFINLHSELRSKLLKLIPSYQFLLENNFIERRRFNIHCISESFRLIKEFTVEWKNGMYNHPICDDAVVRFKEGISEDMHKINLYMQYLTDGILPCNIMDGYDAGFLAPDGTFYGMVGSTSDLLHMQIADALFEGKYQREYNEVWKSYEDPEYTLMKIGYIKIHDANVYGTFRSKKDKDDSEDRSLYCPTPEQVKSIADYIDKYHRGILYTDYHGSTPVKASVLRQADEIQLHEMFDRY